MAKVIVIEYELRAKILATDVCYDIGFAQLSSWRIAALHMGETTWTPLPPGKR